MKIDLEKQYTQYLERVGLKESSMGENQRIEMKRTFMGAWGQALVVMRDDLSAMEEDNAVEVLQDMFDQVGNFFIAESNRQN